MGRKREVYTRLSTKPLPEVRVEYLMHALWEIASGTTSFGHQQEWEDWFRYLLPDLVVRGHETYAFDRLLEHTITAFIEVFWDGCDAGYSEFRTDVLAAVPISLMHPRLWASNREAPMDPSKNIPLFLLEEHDGRLFVEVWGVKKARPEIAAALVFCLKYLEPSEIPGWVESLVQIEHPHWRGALLVWLAGAEELLTAETPSAAPLDTSVPDIGWEASHLLASSFVPLEANGLPAVGYNDPARFLSAENVRAFWTEFRGHLSGGALDEWERQLWSDPRLARVRGLTDLLDAIGRAVAA